MTLYHASIESYKIGHVIGPYQKTRFSKNTIPAKALEYRERYLEDGRPDGERSRCSSVFAFARAEQCVAFMLAENRGDFEVYKITTNDCDDCDGHPMALVEHLLDDDNSTSNKVIVSEYWTPKGKWNYLEFLCREATVTEIMPKEFGRDVMTRSLERISYGNDSSQAKTIVA